MSIGQENFFDDYTVKDQVLNKKDVEDEYYKGVDFSAEELADLRSFQASIPAGYLSLIKLFPKQVENLKTTVQQRAGVDFNSNQLSAMNLTSKQFDSLKLEKEQLARLKISQFEDPKSSPIKYKLANKPSSLSSDELSQLNLSGQQFFQLKLTPEQLANLKVNDEQLSSLQSFAETKLSFEQYEQLRLTPQQMRELVLNVVQLKRLQLLRFKEFQPYLTATQLEKLDLTPEQLIQMELSNDQIQKVKLLPAQVTSLGLEFIKSNAQSLYLEKFASLQESKVKIKSYQFRQLELKSWQLQNIQFDQRQINTLRRIFKANIYRKKYVQLLENLYPIQISKLALTPEQTKKIDFNKEQILQLELTEFQLEEVGFTKEEIDLYYDKNLTSDLLHKLRWNFEKAKLNEKQIAQTQFHGEQFEKVIWTEEQLQKIKKFYNLNILRKRLFEYLLTDQAAENENAKFSNVQLSGLKLNHLQLAMVNYDSYQLRKVGVTVPQYQNFKRKVLKGASDYSVGNIEFKLLKIKFPPKTIINYYTDNGYQIMSYPEVRNFTLVPYTKEQIKELGLSNSEYLLAKSGSINALVSNKLKYSLGKVELSDSQILEFNYRIRNIPRKRLNPREVMTLDIEPELLNSVNLSFDELNFYKQFQKASKEQNYSSLDIDESLYRKLRKIIPRTDQIVKIELLPNQMAELDLSKNQIVLVDYLAQNELLSIEGDELEIYRIAKEAEEKISLKLGDRKTYEIETRFAKQGRSVIDWKAVSPDAFLDLNTWRIQKEEREKHPFWKNILREQVNIESFGRVIDCVGKCILYRGTNWHPLNSRSEIKEKDEVYTGENGHLWIELIDGTTIRVSPKTSLIFNEINLGKTRVFYFLNLNWGNIVWLSREKDFFKRKPQKETDQLFLPSPIVEANYKKDASFDLFSDGGKAKQIEALNKAIEGNNSVIKNVYSTVILAFQNGYFYGDNPRFEVLSLLGNTNYFYNLGSPDQEYWNQALDFKLNPLKVFTKSLSKGEEVNTNSWTELDLNGTFLTEKPQTNVPLYFNQYVIAHTPTMLLAREIFFERYFANIFSPQTSTDDLAKQFGYRLWERETFNNRDDLTARITYLKRYMEREREYHKNLLTDYMEKFEKVGGKKQIYQELTRVYYEKSMEAMIRDTSKVDNSQADRKILNSTEKPFWEVIHKYDFRQGKGLIFKN